MKGLSGPGLEALFAQPLCLHWFSLLLIWMKVFVSATVSIVMGLGTLTRTTSSQISLYILLKSSFPYEYVGAFCLPLVKDPKMAVSQERGQRHPGLRLFINHVKLTNRILFSTDYEPSNILNACFLPRGVYIPLNPSANK